MPDLPRASATFVSWLWILALTLIACAASPLSAQRSDSAREAEVIAVVERLFDAMRSRDTTALRDVFDTSAQLANASTRDERTTIRYTTVDQFVNSVSSAPAGVALDERISSPEVRIDGNLATAWMSYRFYRGDQFSHCGSNAVQLLETGAGWKIVSIADSRRSEGCDPPGN